MKDIILMVVFLLYVIMGYFLMKRLDEFIKNNKSCIKKFKPSWILKLKLLISISQFHGKYQGNNVRKRDIWDTYMVFPFIDKKKK